MDFQGNFIFIPIVFNAEFIFFPLSIMQDTDTDEDRTALVAVRLGGVDAQCDDATDKATVTLLGDPTAPL